MVLWVTLFVLANLGLKIGLACAAVYFLLPSSARCPACDADTIKLRSGPVLGAIARPLGLERRWCLGCESELLARGRPEPRVWVGPVGTREREPTG